MTSQKQTKEKHIHTDLPLTAAIEEGPYYIHGSPERRNIVEPGTPGIKLVLKGHVLDRGSNPVPHAWLDFWQADSCGMYDVESFNLRGRQYAGHDGGYYLETIVPVEYGGFSGHIHAKVRAAKNTPVLTTRLYLPCTDEATRDPIFEEENVMDVTETADGMEANFDFVIDTELK